MSARHDAPPAGYVRFGLARALVVVQKAHADALREAMGDGALYSWAARHPERRVLQGRMPAFAVPLPGSATRVVVRHARHGGMLARITGDVFVGATRAPHELAVAERLSREGVPTPDVVAYALYPVGPLLARADVATREIEQSRDLDTFLRDEHDAVARALVLGAVRELLVLLARAGARHPDLNLKNILVRADERGAPRAWVIDVDRIVFHHPGDPAVAEANLRRLLRSARKLRGTRGLPVGDDELAVLAAHGRAA